MNKLIKTILAIILLLISILLFIKSYIFFAILSIIFSILSIVTIFKHEKIIIAFYYLKRNKLNKSLKILESIKNPENLIKSQYAYYNYLFGLIFSQIQVNKSEKFFKKALSIGLRSNTDKAVAKLNLAGLAINRRRKREATILISEVKKLDKYKMLNDQIKLIKIQLKKI